MRKSLGDLKKSPRDKRKVFSLTPKIHSRVNNIKKSKKTAYKESEILGNYKAPIGIPPVYHIWGL
jgi:hypothetical protein